MYMYIYIYVCIWSGSALLGSLRAACVEIAFAGILHSAKGGAVKTGCSDLNGVIYYFTI